MENSVDTKDYYDVLTALNTEIKNARLRAHLAVNKELILLYWRIGKTILERQEKLGWGSKVIEQLSLDLKHEFPEIKGFGAANLYNMRRFAGLYPDEQFLQQVAGELPWYHHVVLMERVKTPEERVFYIQKTIENGWSRNILTMQIENRLYERQGKALTNFKHTLPAETSDLAQALFKDEYNFEFLNLASDIPERHIERSLIDHIRDFLLELGAGFAFMGSQYKLVVGGDEFFIDMLFFHARLRCYIVIELKAGKFIPEYAGKLSFYLTAVNRQVKLSDDNPTIGLLLCQSANHMVVEYALSENRQPMGVSKYQTTIQDLPKSLEGALPTPEQFQHFFETIKSDERIQVSAT
jgi:predicted nuclease of restriction endonuclease-like (RecB) superfamily